jgi:hypothetical protein
MPVATENRIRAGAAAAMGYSHRRDDRPPEAARRIARRSAIGCTPPCLKPRLPSSLRRWCAGIGAASVCVGRGRRPADTTARLATPVHQRFDPDNQPRQPAVGRATHSWRAAQIACGSRSRDGISPPATCCPAAIRAGEAQAPHCRSLDLRLAPTHPDLLTQARQRTPS